MAENKEIPKKKQEKKENEPKESPKDQKKIQNIIRFSETNIDGTKKVEAALRQIDGISFSFANAASTISGLGDKTFGSLSEAELKKLEEIINNPKQYGIPGWLFNRRKDPDTGAERHIIASQSDFIQKMDINKMKRIKSYKGVRHMFGLPVRGQRTRSSFRKGKVVGVARKKAARPAASGDKK